MYEVECPFCYYFIIEHSPWNLSVMIHIVCSNTDIQFGKVANNQGKESRQWRWIQKLPRTCKCLKLKQTKKFRGCNFHFEIFINYVMYAGELMVEKINNNMLMNQVTWSSQILFYTKMIIFLTLAPFKVHLKYIHLFMYTFSLVHL